MTPYVFKMIPEDDVALFEKVRSVVIDLPDIDLGRDENDGKILLSCHILGRALAKVFQLKHADGYFHPNFEHTWLLTLHSNIIDVYPVAVLGGPILMEESFCSPAKWLYKKKRLANGKFQKLPFYRAVRTITNLIKKQINEAALLG